MKIIPMVLAIFGIISISTALARPDPGSGAGSDESVTGIIVIDGLDQVDLSNRRSDMGRSSAHRILIQLGDLVVLSKEAGLSRNVHTCRLRR